MRTRLAAAAVAAAAALTTTALAAPAANASADTAADCERGANGFVDIPDWISGTPRDSAVPGGLIVVELQTGYISGVLRGWAKVQGPTDYGDLVWLDWTRDGGHSWIQCGPFAVGSPGGTKTSAAQRTNPSPTWQFRACGMVHGISSSTRCTDPWW
ncbi:hypothetical protein M8542_39090 [Amycolatopsis sp. OK19-0408]|uniref:Secreted protein n=1 Tax=Amycolatopsis iheyensis TaxID=2945988 RepID=A0A9X2NHG2_9PSEU|nr:hypothetical protein [Amycolatopsis iheyensis]MCR6488851.1 hypothetical protein [Amycolatopsis iheyensis]